MDQLRAGKNGSRYANAAVYGTRTVDVLLHLVRCQTPFLSSDAPANDLKGSLQDLNAPCDIDESGRCGLTARNWATPEVPLHLPLLRAPSLFAEARCCDVCVTCVLLLLLRPPPSWGVAAAGGNAAWY